MTSDAPRRLRESVTAYIGLGANLGDARATLDAAFIEIAKLPLTRVCAASSLYRSAPVDAGGSDYINAVLQIATSLAPHVLLTSLQRIERAHGRERPYRHAPRTLDLDLLLYGERRIASARLQVPHPRLQQRAFVLQPIAEIAPTLEIPGFGPVTRLLPSVADQIIARL